MSATRTIARVLDRHACCVASLRACNEKAMFRMRALHAALTTSREIYSGIICGWKTIVGQIPAMTPALSKTENGIQHVQ
jgi:hypothetical protein